MTDDAASVRAEWRADEEQWSRAALERWEHARGLADVVRDAMRRGDAVSFAFSDVSWSGVLVAVGDDVARIESDTTPVDVRLAPDSPFVLRTRPGEGDGGRVDATVTTFMARLRELDGTPVAIGTSGGSIEGTLRLGRDQVRLTDPDGGANAGSAYVPAGSVWWVRPLDDD